MKRFDDEYILSNEEALKTLTTMGLITMGCGVLEAIGMLTLTLAFYFG